MVDEKLRKANSKCKLLEEELEKIREELRSVEGDKEEQHRAKVKAEGFLVATEVTILDLEAKVTTKKE